MPQPSSYQSRRFAVIAITVAYVFIEVALWTRGKMQLAWSAVGAAWIVWATVRQQRSARELGIAGRGFYESLWIVPTAAAVGAVMVLAGWLAGTLHGLYGPRPILYHSFGYALWSVEQEFILQSFFYVNIEKIEGNKLKSAAMATGLFAAAHLPNPLLVAATLAIGFCFTQIFRRYRDIYTLGIAHGLLGLALACSLPNDVHRHMRVGLGYLLYRPNPPALPPPLLRRKPR